MTTPGAPDPRAAAGEDAPKGARVHAVQRFLIALWVFAITLALFPYTYNPAAPIKHLVTDAAIVALASAALPRIFRGGIGLRSPVTLTLFAWFGVQLAAALLSEHPLHGLAALRTFAAFLLLYLVAADAYRAPRQAWRVLGCVAAAAALASVYGVVQFMGLDPFPWGERAIEEYRGLPATFGHPNFAGHVLVLAIIAGCALGIARRQPWVWPLVALMTAHLAQTHMRAAWAALGAALALTLALAWSLRRGGGPGRKALRAGGAAMLLGGAGVAAALTAHHALRGTPIPLDGSLLLRYNSYHGAAAMVLDRPLLGYGPGNYPLANPPYWTPYEQRWFATEGRRNLRVHNDALEAGVDAGIPGMTLYLALLTLAIFRGMALASSAAPARRQLGFAFAAMFTAFAADGLFGFNLRAPASGGLFFLLLGVQEGLLRTRLEGSRAAAAALPLGAAACALWGAAIFHGEMQFQRVSAAQQWMQQFQRQGAEASLRAAIQDADRFAAEGARWMPWDARFPMAQGLNALHAGETVRAIAAFERALALHPHNPATLTRLAQAHLQRTRELPEDAAARLTELERARERAKQLAALCPPMPEAHELLGRIAAQRAALQDEEAQAEAGWRAAAEHLSKALTLGPRNRAPVERLLARAHVAAGEYLAAQRTLRRVLETDPLDRDAWDLFEQAAAASGGGPELVDWLERRLGDLRARPGAQEAGVVDLSIRLARAQEQLLDDREGALETLRAAVHAAPAWLAPWGAMIALLPPGERLESTLAIVHGLDAAALPRPLLLLRKLDESPEPAELTDAVRELAAQARRLGAAEARRDLLWLADLLRTAVRELVAEERAAARAFAELAEIYLAAEAHDDAEPLLRAAIPSLPQGERPLYLARHADALAGLDRTQEALALARAAAAEAPNTWEVRLSFARRLADAERTAEARFEYMAILRTFTAIPREIRSAIERELAALP